MRYTRDSPLADVHNLDDAETHCAESDGVTHPEMEAASASRRNLITSIAEIGGGFPIQPPILVVQLPRTGRPALKHPRRIEGRVDGDVSLCDA